jgi:hypothetical protein
MSRKKRFVADFETTTIQNIDNTKPLLKQLEGKSTRVWAWGITNIDNVEWFKYGDDIKGFIEFLSKYKQNVDVFMHNLKFDGSFIVDYLLKSGYTFRDLKYGEVLRLNEFNAIWNKDNQCFKLSLCTMYETDEVTEKCKKRVEITFLDSSKILTMQVSEMPRAFGLSIEKLEIDYNLSDEQDYTLTDKNIQYLKNDCVIPALALRNFLDRGYTKMTMGANALYDYKKEIGKKTFDYMFPTLDYTDKHTGMTVDEYCRESYRGGIVICNPAKQGKTIKGGMSYDINGLYSDRMSNCLMPCLIPKYYEGEYKHDEEYPLWIGRVSMMFSVKEGHIPTIQLKRGSLFGYGESEFLEKSIVDGHWDKIEMTITSVDWELIQKQYNVYNVEWIDGYKFKGSYKLFTNYVNRWNMEKMTARLTGDKGTEKLSKMFMNSLTGKFGTKPLRMNKKPVLDENGVVKWLENKEYYTGSIYVPISCFITAYSRLKLVEAIQNNLKNFLYSDTDSLKLEGDMEEHIGLEISKDKLGAWKIEGKIIKAKYLRVKAYIEELADIETGEIKQKVVCSTMPKKVHSQVTFDNFELGASYTGKLIPVTINGGRVLIDSGFTLSK